MSVTNYSISNILNYNFGKTFSSAPTGYYIGLSVGTLDATIINASQLTGALAELSGYGYARANIPYNYWGASSGGVISNSVAVLFGVSNDDWETANSMFLVSTGSGAGNIWWYTNLTAPISVADNYVLELPIGSISITIPTLAGTNYANNNNLNYFFNNSPVTSPPGNFYFGLSSIAANIDGIYTEPSGNNYSRVAYANSGSYWSASSSGSSLHNLSPITFPTTTGAWGTMLSIFAADAYSGGNILWYQNFSAPLYVQSGMSIALPAITGFPVSLV